MKKLLILLFCLVRAEGMGTERAPFFKGLSVTAEKAHRSYHAYIESFDTWHSLGAPFPLFARMRLIDQPELIWVEISPTQELMHTGRPYMSIPVRKGILLEAGYVKKNTIVKVIFDTRFKCLEKSEE